MRGVEGISGAYGRVLADRATRRTLLLGVLVRIPPAAGGIVLTLHIVAMGRSYAEAGLATTVMTLGLGVSGPWRGRLLDRAGLRRVVAPSLVVLTLCWVLAPVLDYPPLLIVAGVAGVFTIPSFSIIRQAIVASVSPADRRSALALDAVAVELSFMIGPLVGVWAGTVWPTGRVLAGVGLAGVAAAAALWLADPPLREPGDQGGQREHAVGAVPSQGLATEAGGAGTEAGGRSWFTPGVAAVFLAAVGTGLILSGTDIGLVAALRAFDAADRIGVVVSIWCVGSLAGGLVYGALPRAVSSLWLLFGLGAVTLPLAWAGGPSSLAVLVAVAGLLCAPSSTAMVDELSRLVPDERRGEAMGWHGSFMQAGVALGAPVAGAAIDTAGHGAGFAAVGLAGMAAAAAGTALRGLRRRAVHARRDLPASMGD